MARLARMAVLVACAAALALRCGSSPSSPSCTYTVTSSASIPPAGGSATLTVTTGQTCGWSAIPNVSWIAVLVTLVPHVGSGTVQIVAGPNTGAPRSGTVTVAGQTVTVTQGQLQTLSLSGRIREAWVDVGLTGVTVSAVGGLAPVPVTTDRDGNYAFTGLVPGPYAIQFSRPFFKSETRTVTLTGDTTLSMAMLANTTFPLTIDDVSGGWAGGGPYPDEPFRLTLVGTASALSGWYIDRRYSSDSVTGSYSGRNLVFRVPVADGVLIFELIVDDARRAHGLVKNERLGGNFPIQMVR